MAPQQRRDSAPGLQQQYTAEGYVSPLRVLSLAESVGALAALRAWTEERSEDVLSGDMRFKPHLYLPFVSGLVRHPAILDAVAAVLGTDNLLLWSSDFNIKQPDVPGFFSSHQDATYTGLSPADRGVTVWLALSDPVDERHGCMVFWPRSHLAGQLPHLDEPNRDVNNMLSRGQRVEDAVGAEYTEFVAELRGGEASLHHFHLVHRSSPNCGDRPRVGLAMRYIAASVRQSGQVRECVTLVRGRTEHDGFDLEPVLPASHATTTDIELCLAAHADAMARETANYFDSSKEASSYR